MQTLTITKNKPKMERKTNKQKIQRQSNKNVLGIP